MKIEQIILENKGTIIDVRSPEEYSGGHVVGSINIPLQEMALRIDEIQLLTKPLVLCCASGNRSGQACRYLGEIGIACYNAGSWLDVNFIKSKQTTNS